MHVTEAVLEPIRKRYGDPALLEWESEICEREHALATYNPKRMHDVTLFILNGERLALIRKPHFEPGVWRTPVFLATTAGEELAPRDREEIDAARWGTLVELAGPLRARLLETGRAFW